MDPSDLTRSQIAAMVLRICAVTAVTYYSAKWMLNHIDPISKSKKRAKQQAECQLKKLNASRAAGAQQLKPGDFNEHELLIASHLVAPEDIEVSWRDIAGLDSVVQELRETVVLPVRHRHLFQRSQLWRAPKGVLLHGPPGCGKTLMAKAIAKEAGMRFINLDVAMLTDKWYGESQKLATAVFTLAQKLQPCIVFIDEIESFLRVRAAGDHEATAMMKTQFMLLWDGLITSAHSAVVVLGATNRPQDLDKAILRRMPAQFHIGHPLEPQRHAILRLILEHEQVHSTVDLRRLARLTSGFSGSDLREMCRHASVNRMRQFMRARFNEGEGEIQIAVTTVDSATEEGALLALTMEDLLQSLATMKHSKLHTGGVFLEKTLDLD